MSTKQCLNGNLNINKFNSFINQASNAIMCDSNCQKQISSPYSRHGSLVRLPLSHIALICPPVPSPQLKIRRHPWGIWMY